MSNFFGALKKGGTSPTDLEPESFSDERLGPPVRSLADRIEAAAARPVPPSPVMLHHRTAAKPACPSIAPSTGIPDANRERTLHVSVLAPVLPFNTGHQLAAEQYQIIRTKILHHPQKPRFVLISSGMSGDGKSVTSINLAASLALKADNRVLLIDGDLRRPAVARALGIPAVPGLGDVLAGRADLDSALVHAQQIPNLYILPAGEGVDRAADLLDSERWRTLAATVRERFRVVVCDAPPIATVADYELLELAADGVVLVARPNHTGRAACREALASIKPGKLLGVVINCAQDWWLWKTPTYSYYRQAAE